MCSQAVADGDVDPRYLGLIRQPCLEIGLKIASVHPGGIGILDPA